jgi:hypothetical protein
MRSGAKSTSIPAIIRAAVPVDHVVGMKIGQALKCSVGHSCNVHLQKGLLVY